MRSKTGFSVVEMLAAIFVLSLGAVAVSESISGLLSGWLRTEAALEKNVERSDVLSRVPEKQSMPKAASSDLIFELGPDQTLILASPRVDRDASCRFDLVARQCR